MASLTHSVNQGFVIRLCAFLEYCKISCSKSIPIRHELAGSDEIDMLRRLRNHFAHTSGKYDPRNTKQKKLYDTIIEHFNLNREDHPEHDGLFPIPIDTVLKPLVEGCKEYVREFRK